MDDLGNNNSDRRNPDVPIRLDMDIEDPSPPQQPQSAQGRVSHAPLDLGGGPAPAAKPKIKTPKPPPRKAPVAQSSADRITGVKTFFTKLHPGAIEFLDEQIADWLKENPGIHIKQTNVATGEVQAKKTEANIIIMIWY